MIKYERGRKDPWNSDLACGEQRTHLVLVVLQQDDPHHVDVDSVTNACVMEHARDLEECKAAPVMPLLGVAILNSLTQVTFLIIFR